MASRTIFLKGNPIRKEGVASEIMSPGHFVVSLPRTQDLPGTIAFPASAGLVAQGIVFEDELHPDGRDYTSAYAANDNVLYGVMPKGGEVQARLAAGATAVAVGASLAVQTDGTLAAGIIGTHHIVAVAIEAVDNSGGGTEVFIQVEIV